MQTLKEGDGRNTYIVTPLLGIANQPQIFMMDFAGGMHMYLVYRCWVLEIYGYGLVPCRLGL